MISLFKTPKSLINTGTYDNLLHDPIVQRFEAEVAQYVGAKYAVSLNSATSAIFLLFLHEYETIKIPSILPPVVANALLNAGNEIQFTDNVEWVGGSYVLHEWPDCRVIDSAQRLVPNQFCNEARDSDFMIFSFYPTKPVGGCDGGMIVSNNKEAIEKLRTLSFNGMSQETNNWERKIETIGYKMYMNSIQADIAFQSLRRLEHKRYELQRVRELYNEKLGLPASSNTSDHLYRIWVPNNRDFIFRAKREGIICGIHYDALHQNTLYQHDDRVVLPKSDEAARSMVSIPFHEELTTANINKITDFILNQ